MTRYYNFEYDGEMHDIQCDTQERAEKWADTWWFERCEPEGQSESDSGFIVQCDENDDGDVTVKLRIPFELEYVHERSDYDEHNVMWSVI